MNREYNPSKSPVLKIANAILAAICVFLAYIILEVNNYNWLSIIVVLSGLIYYITSFSWRKNIESRYAAKSATTEDQGKITSPVTEWQMLNRQQKIYWGVVVAIWVALLIFTIFFGILRPILERYTIKPLNEAQARAIAEATCIKGGKAIDKGVYDKMQDIWTFNANLNSTRSGCTPHCTVDATTKKAMLNWVCGTMDDNAPADQPIFKN